MQKQFLLLLMTLFVTGAFAQGDVASTVFFDLENCLSNSGVEGSAADYSEFTADISNTSDCATMSVVGDNLYRLNPEVNMHSCAPGVDESIAMCVGIDDGCDYDAGSDKSIRFDISLEPTANMTATLSQLRFFENAPENFQWINGPNGENNYPTLYGIRVLKNGEVIFEESGVPTEQSWNQEIYTFADLDAFIVSETTVFNFELLPYCPVGNGASVAAWDVDNIEIFAGCDPVDGGVISTTDGETEITICAGDGEDDEIDVELNGEIGQNFQWVITDEDANILALPPSPPFNLEGAGPGTCLIWHLAFADGLVGAEVGENAGDLIGSYDLSNPITVVRNGVNGGELAFEGGETEVTICAGDGEPDPLNVELTGNVGSNMAWVITDADGNILGLPAAPPFDLDGAGPGICLIWNLAFADGLTGAEVGMNASELSGCFDLSNPITVVRNEAVGGELLFADGSTDAEICALDGSPDPLDVELTGAAGANSAWVITDTDGTILGLPMAPPFDLDGAGAGTCLIWHLSFADGLIGAEVGMSANDLQGCYNLSNPLTVVRNAAQGGELTFEGGETAVSICAGDGNPDPLNIELTGNIGDNMAWVITDTDGNILGLPAAPPFDLDGAGPGVCLIWNLAYADGLSGAEVGMNASELTGCFDLSNPITVDRTETNGGELLFADGSQEQTICALDGTPDPLDVELTGETGANSAWVITDTDGTILGLPMAPPFDLDGAGVGTCLIWHLSFADGLTGAEVGMNANNLEGCFDLSNPLTVVRNGAQGGELTLENGDTEISICAGDGIADPLNVELTGNVGDNMAWVITDASGMILGLPAAPPFDLEGAGAGTCLIWNLSFADGLTGAEVGNNASELEGCFDLSNPITVIRNAAQGGELSFEDGSTEIQICAGDGNPDPLNVNLSGNEGETAWVITDTDGLILGLPMAPPFDLEGAGAGTCLIWHLGFSGTIEGAEVGLNANDLVGCTSLSNPLTVIREAVEGGDLSTEDGETQITICADDGESDAFDVSLTGAVGENTQWVITDTEGIILGLPMAPPFDLEGAGGGTCLVWNLSYNGAIGGLELESNANNLDGCFELSNPITVTRLIGDNCDIVFCEADGGELTFDDGSTAITICAGDSIPDPLDVILTGESGPNNAWVITDSDANILALPDMPPFDLDGAGEGVCLIWHLSFEDGLTGAEVGNNATDLDGCFDLSNPLTVNRVSGDDCEGINCNVEGGNITFDDGSTSIEICAGDSIPDLVDVILADNIGPNSAWVITDASAEILALPMAPPFDLEGAGPGICLIWHLSFEDGLMGAEVGMSANDLEGCFDLSNPISVTRLTGPACDNIGCDVDGGSLTTSDGETSVEICAGDGEPDPIDVVLTDAVGDSTAWIITDASATILALPMAPPFDLDGAGPGLCLIWNISYSGDLTGLAVGENANNIDGCWDLSNQISVQRYEGDDCALIGCEADGGALTFADSTVTTTICVGDEIDDLLDVSLTGNVGENNQWVITNGNGEILGLPVAPPFDLEGAGSGICLIWNLAYDGEITGAEVGLNANDIVGCHNLSNPISVVRLTGDDCDQIGCEATGGTLTFLDGTTDTIICVGDGIMDPLDVELVNAVGDSMSWVITDPAGMIIGLPSAPPFDLEGAGTGVCLVWNLSYNGEIMGLEMGMNANDIVGCHSLSNPIVIERVEGSDCPEGLQNGGTVNFSIYPNPTSDMITIEFHNLPTELGEATIYDQSGREVSSVTGSEGDKMEVDVHNYNSGIYYVRTISGYSVKVQRMVKIK